MDITIRRDFPNVGKVIYMNNASNSPMPITSIKASMDFMLFASENGPDSTLVNDRIEELFIDTRRRLARLLNCKEEEIVFTQSTTDGINFVSNGLRLEEGDNIIIRDSNHEHPSNYIPWAMLERKGIEVRRLRIGEHGSIDIDELKDRIDGNTRLIAISHVLFNTGLILPIEDISKIAKEHNIPLFIDAAQSVGCMNVDLARINCNFLAFPASKWLCGPSGIGVFYCRKDSQDMLEPIEYGLESCHINNDEILMKDMPDRFEAGFRNYSGLAAFNASLKYIMNISISKIRSIDIKLANMLRDGLKDMNAKVYGPDEEDERNSIVSFTLDNRSVDEILDKLYMNNIIFAKRDILGKNIVRASPHFFNTEQEIANALEIIRSIL